MLNDDYLYVSSSRGVHIFDVRDPAEPGLVGEFTEFADLYFPLEDPATNGKIYLHRGSGLGLRPFLLPNRLYVLDVRDKSYPHVVGQLENAPLDLTLTCVLDCTWVYGSSGTIVDLRDPTEPRLAGDWTDEASRGSSHSISEIAPGRIIIDGGEGPMLLDARKNPEKPRIVADSLLTPHSEGYHAIDWPAMKRSSFVFAGAGGATSCTLISYDASRWLRTNRIVERDRLSVEQTFTEDGGPPASFDCPHWFDAEPSFGPGGLLVAPWHQRGARLVKVAPDGKLSFEGYFYAPNGRSWTTLWGRGDFFFSIDYQRGIDVLRLRR